MKRRKGNDYTPYLIALMLVLITLASFWQVFGCQFITAYDDNSYVTENTHVRDGLTIKSIGWALTATYAYNWHPLTWISHMLDCQIYGLNPAGHHATSLLLHIANAILLFLVLSRMTRAVWPSAFAAALFAVHPLHVESVAWIAERKDVLSTFFWMLTMGAYVLYTERPSGRRYALVLAAFAMGLMSKPMLVTLPFVLLLMDYWPLGRFRRTETKSKQAQPWPGRRLLIEKLPLFALAVASSLITYYAQQHGGAIRSFDEFPITVRIANGLVAYAGYIVKMVWPTKLAVLYPHPGTGLPMWQVTGSAVALTGITALAIWLGRRGPYLAVGWLWYVVTLVPVIGLIQVGRQAMANRYTYIPLIGLFMVIAWAVGGTAGKDEKYGTASPTRPLICVPALSVLAGVIIAALMACTWVQVGHWHDNLSLFRYAVKSTKNNSTASGNLAWAYAENDDWRTAKRHFAEAMRIRPGLYDLHYGLGMAHSRLGDYDAAVKELSEALRLQPDLTPARRELGIALRRQKELAASGVSPENFRKAVDLYTEAVLAGQRGDTGLALRKYTEAIQLRPSFAEAHCNLGVILKDRRDYDGAVRQYRTALRHKPGLVEAHNNLAVVYFLQGEYADAWREVHLSRRHGHVPNPDFLNALSEKMPEPVENAP